MFSAVTNNFSILRVQFVRKLSSSCLTRSKKLLSTKFELSSAFASKNNDFNLVHVCNRNRYSHKAAVLKAFGEDLVVEEVPQQKEIKEEQVRVDVYSCSVNVTDILVKNSKHDFKPNLPFILGFEFSGEVSEVGSNVTKLKPGDRVIGLNKEFFNGFSKECVIDQMDVWQMPQSMAFDQAAALIDGYCTALIAARRANIKPGDSVMVTAAAGGLGLAAVDVAANLFKAKVIGACGTQDKATLVREKGAFASMNYNRREVIDAVKDFSDGQGVKVIFDAVGGEMFEDLLQCVSHEGSIVVVGFASRQIPEIKTNLLLPTSCSLIGVSLSEYRLANRRVYRDVVQEVIDLYTNELIDPHISATFPLEEVNEAFDFVEQRKSTGKVVVDVR